MADKFKKFFEKKKTDLKFKKAGPGHKLTESTASSSSSKKKDDGFKNIDRSKQTDAEKQAAAAALARFGGGPTNSREVSFNTSAAAIQAQVKRELEKERQELLRQQNLANASPKVERKEPVVTDVEAAPVLAVNGVFFKCPLIGEEVLPKEEWFVKIKEFLYASLTEEEKGITSCLMIRTLNKNKEKVDQCVETLIKYLNNIIQNPEEEKYRKIRMSNKIFQDRVLTTEGSLEFLEACGFQKIELDSEEYLLFSEENKCMDLDVLIDALMNCEPIKIEVDRNIRVLNANSANQQLKIQLPSDFFHRSPDELKKEQKLRAEKMELELTLRTKAMREKDEGKKEIRNYKYCIIRIKFPDNYILQGTFSVYEKFEKVLYFIKENIKSYIEDFSLSITGLKFTKQDEEKSLLELKLVPASIMNFLCDNIGNITSSMESEGGSKFIKPEIAVLLQD